VGGRGVVRRFCAPPAGGGAGQCCPDLNVYDAVFAIEPTTIFGSDKSISQLMAHAILKSRLVLGKMFDAVIGPLRRLI